MVTDAGLWLKGSNPAPGTIQRYFSFFSSLRHCCRQTCSHLMFCSYKRPHESHERSSSWNTQSWHQPQCKSYTPRDHIFSPHADIRCEHWLKLLICVCMTLHCCHVIDYLDNYWISTCKSDCCVSLYEPLWSSSIARLLGAQGRLASRLFSILA